LYNSGDTLCTVEVNVALLLVNATRADDGRRARLAGDVLPHSICSVSHLICSVSLFTEQIG